MHPFKFAATLCAAILLASCGGRNDDNIGMVAPPPPPVSGFSSLVSFGDSFSDVGTYAVGTVKALGGGKYTVNTPDAKIWIELVAARLGQPPPCPAQTGLDGDPARGFFVPVTNFPQCTAYAQGGARVTDPIGRGNKALGGDNLVVGQLTVPVVTQIANHLAVHGGRFRGDEIVFVMAGGNDLFIQLSSLAKGRNPLDVLADMARAGDELARLIERIVDAGANYVTVVNLPDASKSPFGLEAGSELQDLINLMTQTFNAALKGRVDGNAKVLYVDAYTAGRDYSANPAQYGITNTTTPACDLSPEKNFMMSSLICTEANVIPGVIDRYQFADLVHPAGHSHQLLADLVAGEMVKKGWLQ